MSKSRMALIQITVSLVLAVVAGVLIFQWTSGVERKAPVASKQTNMVSVVVAKKVLTRGMKLNEEMLQIRKFTAASRPEGAFANVDNVAGRVLNQDVGANEAITTMKLADASVLGGGVSALIEPGKRAMAVKGNAVMGLSGFVRPGDRVDVIVTMIVGPNDKPVTKIVLERVKVLATGKQLRPPDEKGKTASVDIYTLELTPEESELLALAASRGSLHFALRNELDDGKVLTTGSSVKKTLAALRPKVDPKKGRASAKVEVITGSSRTTKKF